MNTELSKKQVGRRLASLRRRKGLSQEQLAKQVRLSRPSLVQIELGNRSVEILELQKLSIALEFSIDDLLSETFTGTDEIDQTDPIKPAKQAERVSVPVMNIYKFKTVLLYILQKCAGKPNVGETVLYKLFYFSDFNYFELYEDHLTGATYRKLPYGPVPQKLDNLIIRMLADHEIERIRTSYYDKTQTRYIPLVNPDLTTINGAEKEVIDRVIEQYGDWSASAISSYSHKDMPWLASKEGEEMDYELVFYREPPYSVRNYGDEIEEI